MRRCLLFFLLYSCSSSSSSSSFLGAQSAAANDEIGVGVILDANTWIGNVSRSCMAMAVEDFYAQNPNYTTRIALHLRDTDQDALGAASAALDLLKNVQVEAIIGPQTSTQAKFVVELGKKTKVPILSFSAKSQLSIQNPYFIRTAWNDSSQAQAIASLVEAFSWREAVLVYEDSDDGSSIIPCLIDALQGVDAHVASRSKISLPSSDVQILAELKKLKERRTRVFIVHMSYSLAFQLFSAAKDEDMMTNEYVWITTYGLTDIIDLMGPSAAKLMQGVLGVRPYIIQNKKLDEVKLRWKNTNTNLSEPTIYGLWAYDTVWALAMAAEGLGLRELKSSFVEPNATIDNSTDLRRLGSSSRGPKLRELILNATFNGVSGEFKLLDGQVRKSDTFEIINVVGDGMRRVGLWTARDGISQNRFSGITWPGGSKESPKGWQWPTEGNRLRIGIPVKPGFTQFVNHNNSGPGGYCIEVFEAVIKELPYRVPAEYEVFANHNGQSNGTYDELVGQVFQGKYDAVVGDMTITANRSTYVDFTMPFTESGVAMIVLVKDQRPKDAWAFMKPLTPNLWFASGAFFIFTGFVVWLLEHRINDEFNSGPPSYQVGTVFYFSFSTLVFAHREKILSNLTRTVVIIWLFVVFILQSNYTASLSSMLTVQQLQPAFSDIDQLVREGSYVGYLKDSFMPGLLKGLKFNESKIIAYESPEEYHDALINRTVAAIVDEIPYLKVFLFKYCNKKFTMVGPIFKSNGFGFVFPKGSPLVSDISKAILRATEKNKTDLEKSLYENTNCFDQDTDTTSSRLTFNSFWGLFLVSGTTSFAALILHLVFFFLQHRHSLQFGQNVSVLQFFAMLVKLYGQNDSSPHPSEEPKPPEEIATEDILASPFPERGLQAPLGISSHAHEFIVSDDDIEIPLDDDYTTNSRFSIIY